MVRVRFAPSPTGMLHVGSLRSGLYNYLFARHMGGACILRIEDTDQVRFVEGAEQNILEMFAWAGIEFDEGPHVDGAYGPYRQSERTAIYREHAQFLIERGTAYYAFDTAEELERMRERQQQAGIAPKYDRSSMRNQFTLGEEETKRLLESGTDRVIRLFVPLTGETRTSDIVRGESVFANRTIDDQILLKSDGFPTYHLANIVDDHLMEITHVIRGEEWLPSLPKHVILYDAFGWDRPQFAHLPLLLSPERKKLSKRDGDVAVSDYKEKGYLPEALVNFVALLGWNPTADREIFRMEEMISLFDLAKVNKAGAIFDIEKLNWMNGMYLRELPVERLAADMSPFMEQAGFSDVDPAYAAKVVDLVKERIHFVKDIPVFADYMFGPVKNFDEEYAAKHWKPETAGQMLELADRLETLDEAGWITGKIDGVVRTYAESLGISAGKLIHPMRLCVTGKRVGAGMFETMEVLGREESLKRLRAYARR
ncbi:MAG TPA: glutamate--tRNA ligase [Candidatus Kapabacteria bacterium]|nr:glutamate--tRNA ligase [Candidatus Kapabacteria bacterium]